MWYNVLTVLAMGLGMLGGVLAYRTGLRDGQAVQAGKEPRRWNVLTPRRQPKPEEDKRLDVLLENLETYDGTGIGQKDVPAR